MWATPWSGALTTILGLAMMFFADFGKYRDSGPAIALCLAVTLIACLTLSPALLRAFGKDGVLAVWRGGRGVSRNVARVRKLSRYERFWDWSSRVIVTHPGLILISSVLLMSPLAWHGWTSRHDLSYDLLRDMEETRPSVQGTKLICKHFLAGETGPLTILAYRKGGEFNDVESKGRKEIATLTKELYSVQGSDGTDGIASVRSIAEPLGDTPGALSWKKMGMIKNPSTMAHFLAQESGLQKATSLDSTSCSVLILSPTKPPICCRRLNGSCLPSPKIASRSGQGPNSISSGRLPEFAICVP